MFNLIHNYPSIWLRLLLLLVVLFFGCTKYSKKDFRGSRAISDSLYIETFRTYSGGALAGDSYSYYVTDSLKFRKFVGNVYHDDEFISCDVKSGVIYFVKMQRNLNAGIDTIQMNLFNIHELKSENDFD